MNSLTWTRFSTTIKKYSWILFLICLPITSFPYFPTGFGGGTLVRPLSLYPLIILLGLVAIPTIIRKPVGKTLFCLIPFLLVAIASTTLSILRDIEPALGIAVLDRTLRGLITLLIGIAIYFTVSLIPLSWNDLRRTLRWIYFGFSLALFWGSLQAIYIIKYIPAYFRKLNTLQHIISIRKLFQTRISGLTYEPNWYAEQISMLLLPWLIASILSGYSVFKWRWHKVTIEWILLAWSLINLAFTYSRAGFINLIILAFFALVLFRPHKRPTQNQKRSSRAGNVIKILEALLLVIIILGMIYLVGQKNPFFARIWSFWKERSDTSFASYIEYLGFGSRAAYLQTSYTTYQNYPFFGVGLGNYAFYFEEMYPDRPVAITPELLSILTPEPGRDRLITPKSMYGRILAETGLAGMATFLVFIIALLGCALSTWLSIGQHAKYWGMAGLLSLIVFLVSANTYDSFAIPNMWVVFGIITAAASIAHKESLESLENQPSS